MNTFDAGQHPNDRDPIAGFLTETLSEEAAMVEPTPGSLQAIQQRTTKTSPARNPWVLGTFGAGLATAAVITAVVVIGNNGSDPSGSNPPAANQSTQTTVKQDGMHPGVYDPNADPANQFTMYYVGPDPDNKSLEPRLFTEVHTVSSAANSDPVAAGNEYLSSTPIDPDYRNPWPDGLAVSEIVEGQSGPTIALVSTGDPVVGLFPDPALSSIALQGLARTVGLAPGDTFGLSLDANMDDVAYRVSADDDVRAFLTIDNLVDGQTVSSPVTVTVSGNVHEGNVNWILLNSDGVEIDSGYTTTSMGMWTKADIKLGDLEPGAYSIKIVEYSMEDGSVQNSDDKTFTVD